MERSVIECVDCGRSYLGMVGADGEIRTIGGRHCPYCGTANFVIVDEDELQRR